MKPHIDKTPTAKSRASANDRAIFPLMSADSIQMLSPHSEQHVQKEIIENSNQVKQMRSYQAMADGFVSLNQVPIQKKENRTGLPDQLKFGIENLSQHSMNDVKVHYNSSKPAQLNAYAYAQGTQIHVAPGQEKHLAHEAWHVVQQKQGRVKPTRQLRSSVHVNDDPALEKEADVMGAKALQLSRIHTEPEKAERKKSQIENATQLKSSWEYGSVVQRAVGLEMELDVPVFTSLADPGGGMGNNPYGFLYSTNAYTRNDISGNAAGQGYKVQMDHGNNSIRLNALNKSFKAKQNISEADGGLANLEYVIGGDHGIDEESDAGKQQLANAIAAVAVAVAQLVAQIKAGNIVAIGGFHVGMPIPDLENYDQAHAQNSAAIIAQYRAVLASLKAEVYVQLTAGINPAKATEFVKNTGFFGDSNKFTASSVMGGKTKNILYDHVSNHAAKGYGLEAYLEENHLGKDAAANYNNMLKGYVMLMAQHIYSLLLRHPHIGKWNENRPNEAPKNAVYMLPQSALSSIIPNSAPPQLRAFLVAQKAAVKTVVENKLKAVFSGGFLGGNIFVTTDAVKGTMGSDKVAADYLLTGYIEQVLPNMITSTVNGFFGQLGGEGLLLPGMSVHDFTYHDVNPADDSKGKKIPIEFRHLKNNTIGVDVLHATVEAILADLRTLNR